MFGHRMIKLNWFFLFFIFYADISYSYIINITPLNDGTRSLRVSGTIGPSDNVDRVNPGFSYGLFLNYYASGYNQPFYTILGLRCSDDRNTAIQQINKEISNAHLSPQPNPAGNYSGDNSFSILCTTNTRQAWSFTGYAGRPLPEDVSCQVTPPAEVDFGVVTIGDNNKTVEKQVSIKCNKATKMRLTLQGYDKTNLLKMSDTIIKLGVGGGAQSKDYDVEADRVTIVNLIFTLSDTGNFPADKKGYVLLISEIP